jgi:hypothetical protein
VGSEDTLIDEILQIEWSMFQSVQNIGGKASCQENPETFKVMRSSQFMSWSDEALKSYLIDLEGAEKEGRNLLSEKYARMMKSTSPVEYSQIELLLPPLDLEVSSLIDEVAEIMLKWEEELSEEFPRLTRRGRPIRSSEDSQFVTSVETYLKGELASYSKKTLQLYYANLLDQKSKNINGARVILDHIVKQYGYESLEVANKKLEGK